MNICININIYVHTYIYECIYTYLRLDARNREALLLVTLQNLSKQKKNIKISGHNSENLMEISNLRKQNLPAYCNTMHHTAAYCTTRKTLHHRAPHCTTPHHTAPCCSTLQCRTLHHAAPHWKNVQHAAPRCTTEQHTAAHYPTDLQELLVYRLLVRRKHCYTLQPTATHCNTLQHTVTFCNTLHHDALQTCKNCWYTDCW